MRSPTPSPSARTRRATPTNRMAKGGRGRVGGPNPCRQGSMDLPRSVDHLSGMNAVPKRGTALLLAHCASLDPASPNAKARLENALGEELARRLVTALCAGAPSRKDDG